MIIFLNKKTNNLLTLITGMKQKVSLGKGSSGVLGLVRCLCSGTLACGEVALAVCRVTASLAAVPCCG